MSGVRLEIDVTDEWSIGVKYARCVPLYPLNPILTLYTTPKFGCIFRPQFSPDAVGRRRPALRSRSFPGRVPAAGENFFKKKSKWTIFFTKFVIFVVFTVIFWLKICVFHEKYKILSKFEKFSKIFENFWKFFDQKIFRKKNFFLMKKIEKM